MIMDDDVIYWDVEKEFDDDITNRVENLVMSLVEVLTILSETELLIPKHYIYDWKKNLIKETDFLSKSFWHEALKDKNVSLSLFDIYGISKIYENNKLITYDNALHLNIFGFLDMENGFDIGIAIQTDSILPYHIINELKVNPDYEKNQQKMTQLLTYLSKNYCLAVDPDFSKAVADGFDIKCNIDNDNDVSIYNERGRYIGWKSINDIS